MSKCKTSDSSKKMVQQKLPEIFTSSKRDKAVTEKDKPKKKLKQAIEKSEKEGKSNIFLNEKEEVSTSTSVRQKSHASSRQRDESEDETFEDQVDIEALGYEEEFVPHDAASPIVESEPEELPRDRLDIRSKLSKPYQVGYL
jgi:hypothetical protein